MSLASRLETGNDCAMCNAHSQRRSRDELISFSNELGLRMNREFPEVEPRYRIGPRSRHVMLRPARTTGIEAELGLWDLIPPGDAKPFLRTNARSDGLRSTWPWKMLLGNRCIVPADGFYEPEKPARAKGTVPWSFYERQDEAPFFFAGLYNDAVDQKTGEVVASYTIITTDANADIRIHDRMPVMLDPEGAFRWLTEEDIPDDLLGPSPDDTLNGWRVGDKAKNSRSPDGPELIAPVS